MTNGCEGILPEAAACCPQNAFGQVTSPDTDPNATCANGYEPGSMWIRDDVSPAEVWIMSACPDVWQCISGCDTDLAHFRAEVDSALVTPQSFPSGVSTPIQFGSSPVYNLPSPGVAWPAPYTTYTVPANGIYRYSVSLMVDLNNAYGNVGDFDIVIEVVKNGITLVSRLYQLSYTTVDNFYQTLNGSSANQFLAGDSITFDLIHDLGVAIDGVGIATVASFINPRPGEVAIDQLA